MGYRKNLVVQWWRFFNEFTIMRPWTVSERQERYQDMERNIQEYCPLVRKEIERSTKTKKWATGWHEALASLRRYWILGRGKDPNTKGPLGQVAASTEEKEALIREVIVAKYLNALVKTETNSFENPHPPAYFAPAIGRRHKRAVSLQWNQCPFKPLRFHSKNKLQVCGDRFLEGDEADMKIVHLCHKGVRYCRGLAPRSRRLSQLTYLL